jgi:hypothetical protein
MLRANRRYGSNERYARMAVFAEDLGRVVGRRVATSQVSRWESGGVAVKFATLRGYEDVLGLASNTLVGVADAQYRNATIGLGPSRLRRDIGQDNELACARIEVLLDQALSGGMMTGSEWDELTVLLTTVSNPFLRPRDWRNLINRLLAEELIASGNAWRPRNESTQRLLWLPRSRPHVIAACADLVRDGRSQILIEPLAILDMASHPNASQLLAEQVTNPTNEQALRGALLASIGHVRYRHYSPHQLKQVTSAAVELLTDSALGSVTRPLAAGILRELPPDMRRDVLNRIRPAVARDPNLATILASGLTAAPGPASVLVGRVAAETVTRLPGHLDNAPDALLETLVGEILHDPNPNVRLHAAQLVGATPLREHLADALCAEIVKPSVIRDATLANAILDALPFIAASRHRRLLEDIILADGLPPSAANTAAWAIGHVPGDSDDAFWRRALDHHRLAWQRRRSQEPSGTLRGLVYSLGTTGHRALLPVIADDATLPAVARSAARWWDNLPSLITASAQT